MMVLVIKSIISLLMIKCKFYRMKAIQYARNNFPRFVQGRLTIPSYKQASPRNLL